MTNSTRKAVVVPIVMEPHENADKLSIVMVDGYCVVVNTAMWEGVSKGTFIPPDNYVPLSNPLFSFLDRGKGKEKYLIKPSKLRGVISTGILVPYGEDLEIGTDVTSELGIEHNDSDKKFSNGSTNAIPGPMLTKYDIDAILKYHKEFEEGENLVVTEKIHGTQLRVMNDDGTIMVGSRKQWIKEDPNNLYWKAYLSNPEIKEFVENYPNVCLYGEVYGMQKNYGYGTNGDYKFAAFDMRNKSGDFWDAADFDEICEECKIPTVPFEEVVKFTTVEDLYRFFETDSHIDGKTVKEGVVVKPLKERQSRKCGRVILKLINPEYQGY